MRCLSLEAKVKTNTLGILNLTALPWVRIKGRSNGYRSWPDENEKRVELCLNLIYLDPGFNSIKAFIPFM